MRLELGLKGVDTVMCLAALPTLDGEQGGVLIATVTTAKRCDPEFADGERMGACK